MTVIPTEGLSIRADTILTPGVYHLPGGLSIDADGVTLDGNGATLIGADRQGTGLRIEGRANVTVRNLRVRDYYHGIYAVGCRGLRLVGNQITSTAEVPPNTIFLDIRLPAEKAYGGAIL